MGEQISWYVELSIKPGQLENFCTLTGEMVDAARHESGVFTYQRLDGNAEYINERYQDAAAALAHLHRFANRLPNRKQRWMDLAQFTRGHSAISLIGRHDFLICCLAYFRNT